MRAWLVKLHVYYLRCYCLFLMILCYFGKSPIPRNMEVIFVHVHPKLWTQDDSSCLMQFSLTSRP